MSARHGGRRASLRWSSPLWVALSACAPTRSAASAPPSREDACAGRAHLLRLRSEHAVARKQTVKLTLGAPVMPQPLAARGAVAFRPPHDLRMILLGPGGGTALDLWMRDRAFRFEVPALGRVLRGDGRTPAEEKRGLPVDFLRWWLLEPFGGEIVYAEESARGLEMVLRDGPRDGASAVVDGTLFHDGHFEATRTTWSAAGERLDTEHLEATRIGCGTVRYEQASTRLTVEAACESTAEGANPRAFVDPDEAAR